MLGPWENQTRPDLHKEPSLYLQGPLNISCLVLGPFTLPSLQCPQDGPRKHLKTQPFSNFLIFFNSLMGTPLCLTLAISGESAVCGPPVAQRCELCRGVNTVLKDTLQGPALNASPVYRMPGGTMSCQGLEPTCHVIIIWLERAVDLDMGGWACLSKEGLPLARMLVQAQEPPKSDVPCFCLPRLCRPPGIDFMTS